MVDLDVGQINVRDGSDEIALQYLGAAVVVPASRPADHVSYRPNFVSTNMERSPNQMIRRPAR
jgi:hypothetical protein